MSKLPYFAVTIKNKSQFKNRFCGQSISLSSARDLFYCFLKFFRTICFCFSIFEFKYNTTVCVLKNQVSSALSALNLCKHRLICPNHKSLKYSLNGLFC